MDIERSCHRDFGIVCGNAGKVLCYTDIRYNGTRVSGTVDLQQEAHSHVCTCREVPKRGQKEENEYARHTQGDDRLHHEPSLP